jgi:beta-aspartyl-peptidase (threonine type)
MHALEFPLVSLLALVLAAAGRADVPRPGQVVLAIHGGAGVVPREKMTPELEKKYRADLEQALREGYKALRREGATSLDAVEAAVKVLEDSPRFNAARGAVFNHDGRNELDAAIMEGKAKRAGAVAGLTIIKNPISAARAVMEKSPHVLLVGRGADLFATEQGLEVVDPSYFWTRERWLELQDALREEKKAGTKPGASGTHPTPARHFGTVGAVAVDRQGNLAAATSTGGLTNKRFGRVGDSPLIGAGTYADNDACAVSATGHGEVFIRYAVAHEIVSLVKYKKLPVQEAADAVLGKLPPETGGVGGVIVLDAKGDLAFSFNTEGMYRGSITRNGTVHVAIYAK